MPKICKFVKTKHGKVLFFYYKLVLIYIIKILNAGFEEDAVKS